MEENPESWLSPGALLRLALPAAGAAVLHQAYRPLDQFFVGSLGSSAQGALGACTFVLILLYGLAVIISGGTSPIIGRLTGEGDTEKRATILLSGLAGSFIVGLVMIGIGLFFVPTTIVLLGLEGDTASHASAYLTMILFTGMPIAFAPVVDGAFAAIGNTRFPLILQVIALVLNAVFTPLFIFTAGLGTAGAALGSTASQAITVAIGLLVLTREMNVRWYFWEGLFNRLFVDLRRISWVGAPIAAGVILYAAVYWGMLKTSITPLGEDVVAGLGLGFSGLEAFTWPLFLGCTVAMQSLTGRLLGAERVDLIWRAWRILLPVQVSMGFVVGVLFYVVGPTWVWLLAADEAAYQQAALYAIILAFSQPFVSVEAFSEGVLAGAGDTRTLFMTTVPFNLLRVPLAWFLAIYLGWGAMGIWWAINITTVFKAALKAGMVLRGRWTLAAV